MRGAATIAVLGTLILGGACKVGQTKAVTGTTPPPSPSPSSTFGVGKRCGFGGKFGDYFSEGGAGETNLEAWKPGFAQRLAAHGEPPLCHLDASRDTVRIFTSGRGPDEVIRLERWPHAPAVAIVRIGNRSVSVEARTAVASEAWDGVVACLLAANFTQNTTQPSSVSVDGGPLDLLEVRLGCKYAVVLDGPGFESPFPPIMKCMPAIKVAAADAIAEADAQWFRSMCAKSKADGRAALPGQSDPCDLPKPAARP